MRSTSAPATGTPARLRARISAWNSADRRCTRISTSPGRMARPPSAPGSARPLVKPAPDRRRDRAGQRFSGIVRRRHVERRVPGMLVRLLRLLEEGPELDAAGRVRVDGVVRHRSVQTSAGRPGEDGVDQREDRRGRAEGVEQVAVCERRAHVVEHRAEPHAHRAEGGRVGPLETVDRLLLVADHEDGAQRLAGAEAREELRRYRLDHPPLRGAGVLRLVDEDVVEPAVEPPEHPGRGLGTREQRAGPVNEVVEVHQAERGLARAQRREPGPRERVQRPGLLEGRPGHARGPGVSDAQREGVDVGGEMRMQLPERLDQDGLRGERIGRCVPGQKRGLEQFLPVGGVGLGKRGGDPFGGLLILLSAGGRERGDRTQHLHVVRVESERKGGLRGIDAHGRGQGRGVERAGEGRAPGADLDQQRIGIVAAQVPRHRREIRRAAFGHRVEGLGAKRAGLALLQHGEAGRDPGLERKPAQQRVAEGVDRLDLEPAWGFERPGEQGAGPVEPVGRDRGAGLAECGQGGAQLGLGQHRPSPEGAEQPALHLGGGGLGVGEAQDLLRLGPGEQQPRNPVGQHPGLARAGVGGDPARRLRPGGGDLRVLRRGQVRSSASGSSPSAHSPNRDRWS